VYEGRGLPTGGQLAAEGQPATSARCSSAEDLPSLLQETRKEVEARLQRLLGEEVARLQQVHSTLGVVGRGLSDLTLRGGKRWRAALTVLGERAAGGAFGEAALQAATALELLQSYFLVQDDWMDQDELRRGGPTLHHDLARHFGSPHEGAVGAVLAGDYAQALATQALADLPVPSDRLPGILACFAQMQRDAVAGQQLDLLAKDCPPLTICDLKTTSYSIKGPLVLGALVGGAEASILSALKEFAEPVGAGFQLRDDLLGAFSEQSVTGKPSGNDLKQGKPTLLVQQGLQRLDARPEEPLRLVWGNPHATPEQLERACTALERCGARKAVEDEILALTHRARTALERSMLPSDSKRLLGQSIDLLLHRSY
jgi:geranylgeranyl diphosphate synthase, type I